MASNSQTTDDDLPTVAEVRGILKGYGPSDPVAPLRMLPSREDEVRRCLRNATMLLRLDRKTLVLSRAKLCAFGCSAEEIKSLAYDWEIQE